MIRKLFLTLVSFLILSSCAHAPVKKSSDISINVTGDVLDQATLIEGGTLGLAPFKAGPNAEANDELDRVSAMVIKGIKEVLDEQKSSLRIIDDSQGHPKIALEGYVQELSKTGKLSRMMLRTNQNTLSLVGDLWLVSNGKRLLEFSVTQRFNSKRESFQDVAYAMGHEIGKYIIYNTMKEHL